MRLLSLALAAAVTVASAAPAAAERYRDTSQPIGVVTNLDIDRYLGRWYEIARFPVWFERNCQAVTADYALNPDGTIAVVNTCRKGSPDGPKDVAEAVGRVISPGKLEVNFVPWLPFTWGDYWVLHIDRAYSYAVVGNPGGKSGWILARSPDLSQADYEKAISVLESMGYDTSRMERVEH